MTTLFFVGPLPPPVHGFSVINEAMLSRLADAATVLVFNRAPPAHGAAHAHASARPLASWPRFLRSAWRHRRDAALYLGLSGGLGQLKDMGYLMPARWLGWPVVVHHHSFAYLNPPGTGWRAMLQRWAWRFVLGQLRGARHLVLCGCMGHALSTRYGIPPEQVATLSNAAFLGAEEPVRSSAAQRDGEAAPLRLGFLSNITAEKGIWDFFALADALNASGVAVQALIAGPAAPELAQRLAQEVAARPWCHHVGPVYGADKADFFSRIDVLAFPTRYANEAEPVTLLEALRAGVPVLATARGCISEMLPDGVAWVVEDPDRFVPEACSVLDRWMTSGDLGQPAHRDAARAAFVALRMHHGARLNAVVAWLSNRGCLPAGVASPWERP